MKQFIPTLVFAIAIANVTTVNAQDTSDTNQSDLQQLQQLACTGNNNNSELQTSLQQLETTLTQTLAAGGIQLDDEQLQAAYNQALDIQNQLQADSTVQQFCSGF